MHRLFGIFVLMLFAYQANGDSIVRPKPKATRLDTVKKVSKDTIKKDTSRRQVKPTVIAPTPIRQIDTTPVVMGPLADSSQLAASAQLMQAYAKQKTLDSLKWIDDQAIKRPIFEQPSISSIKLRTRSKNRWVILMATVILILIGLNRALNVKRYDKLLMGSLVGAPIKSNEAVYKELSIHQLLSTVIIALVFGLALHLLLPLPFINGFSSSLSQYFFFVSVVIFVYGLKAFFYHLVLTVLQIRESPNLLFSQFIMITYVMALVVFPLLLVWQYTPFEMIKPYLLWACVFIIIILFIIRLTGITNAFASMFPYSIFYLFIYLCTLEIIPWLLIIQGYRLLNQ